MGFVGGKHMTGATDQSVTGGGRSFFGHPRGLLILFNTELWERFSYYGMRAILLYYITGSVADHGLGISLSTGLAIVSIYGASVYLLSIVGGWIADRVLGVRHCVLYGGLVIMAGHLSLAVPLAAFSWLGIVLVALGTGLLKPNVSTMVGALYTAGDPRRDAGFSIFYMGINIGSLLAPLVVGSLRAAWGYHAGFAAAAVGMGLALVFFLGGRHHLVGDVDVPGNPLDAETRRTLPKFVALIAAIVVASAVVSGLLRGWGIDIVIDVISVFSMGAPVAVFYLLLTSPKVDMIERRRVRAYIPLWIAAMAFWMIFEQAATTMARFAEQRTMHQVFGWQIEPEFFQSINPVCIVLLAPVFGWLWIKRAGKIPHAAQKLATGLLLAGVSFLLLSAFAHAIGADGKLPALLFASIFVIQSIGELCLSPVGLSVTTQLAPKAFASQMMALWFLSSASGQAITAQVVQMTANADDATYFMGVGAVALGLAACLVLVAPWVQRQIGPDD